jgi:Domain of Unknown Function (DUF1080)
MNKECFPEITIGPGKNRFVQIKRITVLISCAFLLLMISCGRTGTTREKTSTVARDTIAEWRQLFNGSDLTGWKHIGPGRHFVEDSLIKSEGGMGLLYRPGEKFGNCKIRVVFRMRDENSNSGVFIRMPVEPREEWMPVHYGYEVQIDNKPELSNEDDYHYTATLYSLTKPLTKAGKPGPEWNTMEITLDGSRTVVYLNDMKVTDYAEGDSVPERKFDFEPFRGPRPDSGYIGIQNHGDADVVFFKEVAVQPLIK